MKNHCAKVRRGHKLTTDTSVHFELAVHGTGRTLASTGAELDTDKLGLHALERVGLKASCGANVVWVRWSRDSQAEGGRDEFVGPAGFLCRQVPEE